MRNVHQAFSYGSFAGAAFAGLSLVTGGWWFKDPMPGARRLDADAEARRLLQGRAGPIPDSTVNPVKIDRQLTFDRLTNVHYSGTRHPEDQPSHLIVHDASVCARAAARSSAIRASASARPTSTRWSTPATARKKLQINASNCVHCKTCDIMDPYQIIDWVPPEGGGGPQLRRHVASCHV